MKGVSGGTPRGNHREIFGDFRINSWRNVLEICRRKPGIIHPGFLRFFFLLLLRISLAILTSISPKIG